MVKLTGEIIWQSGMGYARIFQRGNKFVLSEQSEMMTDATETEFDHLEHAVKEMFSHT